VEQDDEPQGVQEQAPDEPMGEMAQVARIAHDLNNVLNVMLIYSELIDRSADGRAPQRYVDEVREAAERGSDLTGSLMRISRHSS
jgi:signal transduction histidine kinase